VVKSKLEKRDRVRASARGARGRRKQSTTAWAVMCLGSSATLGAWWHPDRYAGSM